MVVLTSNLPKGICYVETKNLDGETNLKHKQASKQVNSLCTEGSEVKDEAQILEAFRGATIECEKQNDSIYTFAGFMKTKESDSPISIDVDQILLRGSSLRNTEYVYGIAVYTGHDTKIMMNSTRSRSKMSKLEVYMNRYIIQSIFIQFTVCLLAAVYTEVWTEIDNNMGRYYYLELNKGPNGA